jgi:signal transduction histidine kinase
MRREVARMDRIVEGLLDYARPGAPSGSASLPEIARQVVGFLTDQGALKAHEVILEVSDTLQPVRGDRKALEQVLVNLLLNSRDASPAGGRIWVGVEVCCGLCPARHAHRRSGHRLHQPDEGE